MPCSIARPNAWNDSARRSRAVARSAPLVSSAIAQRITPQHVDLEPAGNPPGPGQVDARHPAASLHGVGLRGIPGHLAEQSLRLGRMLDRDALCDQAAKVVDRPLISLGRDQRQGRLDVEPGQAADQCAGQARHVVAGIVLHQRNDFIQQTLGVLATAQIDQAADRFLQMVDARTFVRLRFQVFDHIVEQADLVIAGLGRQGIGQLDPEALAPEFVGNRR